MMDKLLDIKHFLKSKGLISEALFLDSLIKSAEDDEENDSFGRELDKLRKLDKHEPAQAWELDYGAWGRKVKLYHHYL